MQGKLCGSYICCLKVVCYQGGLLINSVLQIHSAIEIALLIFLSADFILRLILLRPRTFITFKHRASYIVSVGATSHFIIIIVGFFLQQSVVLLAMFFEAIVLLIRQDTHVRVLRALRPVFFIDNHLMSGVRR